MLLSFDPIYHIVNPQNLADIVIVGNSQKSGAGHPVIPRGGAFTADFGVGGGEEGVSAMAASPENDDDDEDDAVGADSAGKAGFRLLDAFPDVKPAPVIGPGISFAGYSARWTGKSGATPYPPSTLGQNRKKYRINSLVIIHCPTSARVSKVSK